MRIPRSLTPHTVTVRRYQGNGAYGDVFGEPEVLHHVYVEEKTKMVVSGTTTGITSVAEITLRPEHGYVPPESEVDLPSGRTAVVQSTAHYQMPPAPEHYVVTAV